METSNILNDIMHTIAQSVLTPSVAILLFFMAISVIELGGFVVECIIERRKFKADIPLLLKNINEQSLENVPELIQNSGLLKRHRNALIKLLENKNMPKVAMTALANRLLTNEENTYKKSLELAEIICKVAPMFGLLGTLIPLGPGLLALGEGNVDILSQSMLVAFDTTISGIISAGICFIIVTIRRRWYSDYISLLETIMESLLEKVHPTCEAEKVLN